MKMKTSQVGKNLIKHFEGFRAIAYLCPAGVWTIGYGTTRINGKLIPAVSKITTDEADVLLEQDLKVFEDAINQNVTVKLSQNQFDALASFVYNVGAASFKKSTLLKKLNADMPLEAAKEFLKWNKANKVILPGLTKRRTMEKELFLSKD